MKNVKERPHPKKKQARTTKTSAKEKKTKKSVPRRTPSMGSARIGTLITPLPYTIGREQPLARAHAMMNEHGIRHLPVLEGGKLVGMLSQRDLYLIETFKDVDPKVVLVDEAFSRDPFSVRYDATVAEVAKKMADRKYGAVAVVDDDGQVVGVFTTVDALRALATA